MPPRQPWPPVVAKLADELVRTARGLDLHGRLRIRETRDGYELAIVIPHGETVMTRAWSSGNREPR